MRALTIAVTLFIGFILAPSYAGAISLPAIVQTGLHNNLEVSAAKANWESAKSKIPQALSLDNPKIGLEYQQDSAMKMYTAEQMIMFPGKIYAEYLMAGREADRLGARYRAKALAVSSELQAAYLDLFLADRSIDLMREVTLFLSSIKKAAQSKYIVGGVTQADVLQSSIEYLLMNNELTTLRQERKVKETKLKAILNQMDSSAIETDPALNLPGAVEAGDALEKAALKNRPELLEMKAEFEMKDYAQLKAKMDFFPDMGLGVKKRVGDGWDAMFSFSVPLYFWKQGYGLAAADLDRSAAEASFANMKNMTVFEVREARVMADSARRSFLLYEESILPQANQALKTSLAAYQSGKVDFQTLLQAERMYREAKLKYYENQVQYGKALAELDRLTGGKL